LNLSGSAIRCEIRALGRRLSTREPAPESSIALPRHFARTSVSQPTANGSVVVLIPVSMIATMTSENGTRSQKTDRKTGPRAQSARPGPTRLQSVNELPGIADSHRASSLPRRSIGLSLLQPPASGLAAPTIVTSDSHLETMHVPKIKKPLRCRKNRHSRTVRAISGICNSRQSKVN
jgi:hypothetical protein